MMSFPLVQTPYILRLDFFYFFIFIHVPTLPSTNLGKARTSCSDSFYMNKKQKWKSQIHGKVSHFCTIHTFNYITFF